MELDTKTKGPLYHPLSESKREFRLLSIQKLSPVICCNLVVASLNDPPPYAALSYTWGRREDGLVRISVNGHRFDAQINLEKALKSLHSDCKDSWIWIDAICINQADNDEKAWQIEEMVRIYEKADLVFVWLGPTEDGSDMAMDSLERLGGEVISKRGKDGEGWDSKAWDEMDEFTMVRERILSDSGHAPAACHENEAELADVFGHLSISDDPQSTVPGTPFLRLLNRAWWQRAWVVQEFTVARNILFACGDRRLPWDKFEAAIWAINFFQGGIMSITNGIADGQYSIGLLLDVKEAWQGRLSGFSGQLARDVNFSAQFQLMHRKLWRDHPEARLPLKELLMQASSPSLGQGIQATQSKDIVYALKGLASDANSLGIDWRSLYPSSHEEIFTKVAKALIDQDGSLDLLSCCRSPDVETGRPSKIPSWVPNWCHRPKFIARGVSKPLNERLDCPFACSKGLGNPGQFWKQNSLGVLRVEGLALGSVDAIFDQAPHVILNDRGVDLQESLVQSYDWLVTLSRACRSTGTATFNAGAILSTVLADQVMAWENSASQWMRLPRERKAGLVRFCERYIFQGVPMEEVWLDISRKACGIGTASLIEEAKMSVIHEMCALNGVTYQDICNFRDRMKEEFRSDPEYHEEAEEDSVAEWGAGFEIHMFFVTIRSFKQYEKWTKDGEDEDWDDDDERNVIGADFADSLFFERMEQLAKKRGRANQTADTQDIQNWSMFVLNSVSQMDHRRIFRTSEELLGLGPEDLQEKDLVIIAKGARVPFIIRPHKFKQEEGKKAVKSWRFVGECYVHGVMDGEWVEQCSGDREPVTFEIE